MVEIIVLYALCIISYIWIIKFGGAEKLAKWMHWLPLYPSNPDAYKLLATIWFVVVTIWFLIDILK